MVACVLSAVTVVTMSAPLAASSALPASVSLRPLTDARLRRSFAEATGSTSKARISLMPNMRWKASTWNSLWQPLPMIAMLRASARAIALAASAEVGGGAHRGGERHVA